MFPQQPLKKNNRNWLVMRGNQTLISLNKLVMRQLQNNYRKLQSPGLKFGNKLQIREKWQRAKFILLKKKLLFINDILNAKDQKVFKNYFLNQKIGLTICDAHWMNH